MVLEAGRERRGGHDRRQYDPVAVVLCRLRTTVSDHQWRRRYHHRDHDRGFRHSTGAFDNDQTARVGAGVSLHQSVLTTTATKQENKYYHPNCGYGGMPYLPAVVRTGRACGNGRWYPSHGYSPPPGYGNKHVNDGNRLLREHGRQQVLGPLERPAAAWWRDRTARLRPTSRSPITPPRAGPATT